MINNRILLVGGAPKAGTTSLHHWLSHHSGVSSGKLKETRFFLDQKYNLPRAHKVEESADQFLNFYDEDAINSNGYLLDSTPDYLYCDRPLQIPTEFFDAKVIIVLRDPTARFLSHYKYAKNRGLIGEAVSLDDFFESQNKSFLKESPPHLNALQMGLYDNYLKKYVEIFNENLLLIQFDELVKNPSTSINKICEFLEIDPNEYQGYEFQVHNKTDTIQPGTISLIYVKTRRLVAFFTVKYPILHKTLKYFNRFLKCGLSLFYSYRQGKKTTSNSSSSPKSVEIDSSRISDFYSDNS